MTSLLGARCALHPDRPAEGTCERCGNFACAACCASALDGKVFCVQCAEFATPSRYHVVPTFRFVLFSTLTFNAYSLYWFWKNWSNVKRADRSDIWPIARALFGGFTYFTLLTDINTQLALRNPERARLSSGLGIGFLVSSTIYRLPNPYNLLGLLHVVFLVPAVIEIQRLASPDAIRDSGWRLRHTLAMFVAVPFFVFAVFGSFLPG